MRLPVNKQTLYWGIALALLALTLWRLGNAIMPFVLGAGIAYIFDPVADWLQRRGLSRIVAVVVITLAMILVFVIGLLVVVPVIMRQTGQLIEAMPQMLSGLKGFLSQHFPQLLADQGPVSEALANLGTAASERGGELLGTMLGSVLGLFSMVALLVIAPVVAFYLLLDWNNMVGRLDQLLPREHAPVIRALAHEVDETLSGFLWGQGLVILILAVFYSVSLALIGLPYGIAIGVLAATLSFIPYVGVLVGGATAIGVALFSFWGQPVYLGAVIVVFVIGQIAEGNYLQPKIIGGHVGLHPVWLMLALSVFGSLFGFVGLLIAVPLAASLGVLVRFAAARYKESALYTGAELPPAPASPILVETVPPGTSEQRRARALADRAQRLEEIRQEELMGPPLPPIAPGPQEDG